MLDTDESANAPDPSRTPPEDQLAMLEAASAAIDDEQRKRLDARRKKREGTERSGGEAATSIVNAEVKDSALVKRVKKKKKVKVKFEKYTSMANMIAMHLRQLEDSGTPGLTQGQIVEYYLSQCDLGDDEDMKEMETKLCQRVIRRLLEKDNVLVRVDANTGEDSLISVHPNYHIA